MTWEEKFSDDWITKLEAERTKSAERIAELEAENARVQKAFQLLKALEQVTKADVLQAQKRIAELEAELAECKDLLKLKAVAMIREVTGDKELAALIDGYEQDLKQLKAERDSLREALDAIPHVPHIPGDVVLNCPRCKAEKVLNKADTNPQEENNG